MQNNLNRIMLKTAAWTLGIAFVGFSYGCAILGIIIPLEFSSFCDRLGAASAAARYQEMHYRRNPTSENLYATLEKFIQTDNSKKVTEHFETLYFEKNADYLSLTESYNNYFLETIAAAPPPSKTAFTLAVNEDSRLKSAYAMALIKTGHPNAAADFYKVHCLDVDLQHPNRVFFAFAATGHDALALEEFEVYYGEFKSAYEAASPALENNGHLRPLFFLMECARYMQDDAWQTYRHEYDSRPLGAVKTNVE